MIEQDLAQKTKLLADLIGRVKMTAIDAWQAGKLLDEVKQDEQGLGEFKTFEEYTQKEFKVTGDTAQKYIDLYKNIPIHLISDKMLLTHLYIIAEMNQTTKTKLLEAMNLMEQNGTIKDYPYDGEVVNNVKDYLSVYKGEAISEEGMIDIWKLVWGWKEEDKKAKAEQGKKGYKPPRMGDDLKSNHFRQFEELYDYQPIDEQGLVGLFCVIFHVMKGKPFEYEINGKKERWEFSKIVFIRQPFPDAQIRCKIVSGKKNEFTLLDVEFEFKSSNFIRHGHDKDKCGLIVCWVDNLPNEHLLKVPPILSIKKFIEEGQINLRF